MPLSNSKAVLKVRSAAAGVCDCSIAALKPRSMLTATGSLFWRGPKVKPLDGTVKVSYHLSHLLDAVCVWHP